jgi:Protein of unknown function (DUF3110)
MRVYVLLFNANTDNEGIHTISVGERNLVLMFEEEDDAVRYALLLEAQDFPEPSAESCDRAEIEEFCDSTDYSYYFIPKDFRPQNDFERFLLAPPEINQEQLDWAANGQPDGVKGGRADGQPGPNEAGDGEGGEMSNSELDHLRRRLESLL